jgi:hypothetical protein
VVQPAQLSMRRPCQDPVQSLTGTCMEHAPVCSAKGVGPATLDKVIVTYRGAPVHNANELLTRCCGLNQTPNLTRMINAVPHYVFAPREDLSFLSVVRT